MKFDDAQRNRTFGDYLVPLFARATTHGSPL